MVFVGTAVSRGSLLEHRALAWWIRRSGGNEGPLRVKYQVSAAGKNRAGEVVIPAAHSMAWMELGYSEVVVGATTVVRIDVGDGYCIGCPAAGLAVMEE